MKYQMRIIKRNLRLRKTSPHEQVLYFETRNDVNSAYYNNESQGTFMYIPVYSS